MRTPEQIKNRLECYHRYLTDKCEHLETECRGCELNNTPGYTISEMVNDALLLIGQLEMENAQLVEDYTTWQKRFAEICREVIVPAIKALDEEKRICSVNGGLCCECKPGAPCSRKAVEE